MSDIEMVSNFIQLNGVKRFTGYTGTPKMDKQITLNAKSEKRRGKYGRNTEAFGKYIERNY